jgi:hypothetical protein
MLESDIDPIFHTFVQAPGSLPRALAFRLGTIPGIPDTHTDLTGGIRLAAQAPALKGLGADEAEAMLGSLAECLTRSRYHRRRFEDLLDIAKTRRAALGGPVVGDWQAVGKLSCEASAFLAAARAAIDMIVYIAARRAGKSEAGADAWEANDAIKPKVKEGSMPPTRYDVPEVLAIRARQPWFDELNHYRNVPHHRGWGDERYVLFLPADTAPEAEDPNLNAMLLPDLDCLRDRKRPHDWTYKEKRRLDDLVFSLDRTLGELIEKILTEVWGTAVPPPGTIPRDEQPNTMLFLPAPVALDYPGRRVIPIFNSKPAAKAFDKYGATVSKLELRAVRPTRVGKEQPAFLLPIAMDPPKASYGVQLHRMREGKLAILADMEVDPANGALVPGVVGVQADNLSTIYVWQGSRNAGDTGVRASG